MKVTDGRSYRNFSQAVYQFTVKGGILGRAIFNPNPSPELQSISKENCCRRPSNLTQQ
jgi:hypothetical protein